MERQPLETVFLLTYGCVYTFELQCTSHAQIRGPLMQLPVLIVVIVLVVLILIACIRRFTYRELGAGAVASGTQNQPAGQAPTTRPGRRRRPARTPSQISTKSLPPYMKEPGDHELVIFKCAQ